MTEPATTIIIFAHGSKVSQANATIARLAGEVSRHTGVEAHPAFLEVAQPDLRAAVAGAVTRGAARIVIVPCFLVYGVHVREDLPQLVKALQQAHPGVEIIVTEPLEGHPGLGEILASRVRDALARPAIGDAEAGKG
jgi:sirohydrochlorin ferrochelatase